MSQESILVPKIATLEDFVDAVEANEGLDIGMLPKSTTLLIKTQNSSYQLIVIDPVKRSVRLSSSDSEVIREPMDGILNDSTLGGSMLKQGWIGISMGLDVHMDDGRTFTSSPVQSISFVSFAPQSAMVH